MLIFRRIKCFFKGHKTVYYGDNVGNRLVSMEKCLYCRRVKEMDEILF